MQYTVTYSNPDHLKKYSWMEVLVNFEPAKKYSIEIRPFMTRGCSLTLFDENKTSVFQGQYSYLLYDSQELPNKVALEIAENINLLLECANKVERVEPVVFQKIIIEVLEHCELMDRKEFEALGYAAKIIFQ